LSKDSFESPFSVKTPQGAEGWERLYPQYMSFSEQNREDEESTLWFWDSMHHMEPLPPFDTISHEAWGVGLGEFSSRIFPVPPAYGIDQRILNGYLYIRPIGVTDVDWIGTRAELFAKRAGYYYENWDDLFAKWKEKMEALIRKVVALEIPVLPRVEDEEIVTGASGVSSGHLLISAYDQLIESIFLAYQYHFEMLNLAYAAYLNLLTFCKEKFPGVQDATIVQMVAGNEILFFRPDDEIKALARLAIELDLHEELKAGADDPRSAIERLASTPNGKQWVERLEAAKDPWFNFSGGTGLYHHERSWVDDLTVPWVALTGYIDKLLAGKSIERPTAEILERRELVTSEYRKLLGSDDDREIFDQNVALARLVDPYVEDHNFYIENWFHTIFWNKIREIGDRLVTEGFLDDREDVFFLNRWEVGQALFEAVFGWSTGARKKYTPWRDQIVESKRILAVLREWTPPPALGPIPDEITEPFTVLLWGITTDRIKVWLGSDDDDPDTLKGVPASPGVREGTARVIRDSSQLSEVIQDEILVCPITAPAWGAIFGKIQAAVSDIGGIMSHAAIVSREYGLPAVVGTGTGTSKIRTGDRIRVDGDTGIVTILERA
jgi:pyruvate,water dikinase